MGYEANENCFLRVGRLLDPEWAGTDGSLPRVAAALPPREPAAPPSCGLHSR